MNKFFKMTFAGLSIASSIGLLLLVAQSSLIPIHLADALYVIGVIGLVSGLGTYALIVIDYD